MKTLWKNNKRTGVRVIRITLKEIIIRDYKLLKC